MARDDRLALLEQQLRALGPEVAVPDANGISSAVRRRIDSGTTNVDISSIREAHPRRRVLLAIAAVLLVVVITTLAIGRTRDAVADWLGLQGVEIEHTSEPLSGPGGGLHLGRPVALDEARPTLDFEPLVAARAQFGPPDATYVAASPPGGRVTFAYAPHPGLPAAKSSGVGLLITEFEGSVDAPFLGKTAGPDTTIETLTVNGQRAYWLEGEPHGVAFRDRDGKFFQNQGRLAGNTLLFANGSRTIRIESGLSKAEALAVAASLEAPR